MSKETDILIHALLETWIKWNIYTTNNMFKMNGNYLINFNYMRKRNYQIVLFTQQIIPSNPPCKVR